MWAFVNSEPASFAFIVFGVQSGLKLEILFFFFLDRAIPTLPGMSLSICLQDSFKSPSFLNSTLHVVVGIFSTQFLRGLDTPEKGTIYIKGLLKKEQIVQKTSPTLGTGVLLLFPVGVPKRLQEVLS